MKWFERPWIDVGRNQKVSSLWHCFGVKDEICDQQTILAMLQASGTTLLPVNCHRIGQSPPVYGANLSVWGVPIIGHGTVTWEQFRPHAETLNLIPCLNINLQTSARAAVDLARRAHEMTDIDLLKLEVLTDDLSSSDDEACVAATQELQREGFRVMPLLSANLDAARELDVPVLRIMGSPIGSGRGIEDTAAVRRICALGVPVILDGGIGYNGHILEAFRLGCAGVLVNSMLFSAGDPVGVLRAVRPVLRDAPRDWPGLTDEEIWLQRYPAA